MLDLAPEDRTDFATLPASQEAGVAEALELYMRVEEIYVEASASLQTPQATRTSNSTNSE